MTPFLDRLRGILALGEEKILVLVTSAGPAHLGHIFRALVAIDPAARVAVTAPDLAAMPDGALVLLPLRFDDAGWLNLNRPLFATRRLRVVLLCDSALDSPDLLAARSSAPDFFDWISHALPAERVLPRFASRTLHAALRAAPGVAWSGPGLDDALRAADPTRSVVRVRADAGFPTLVDASSGAGSAWIVVERSRGRFLASRVHVALAAAGARERNAVPVFVDAEDSGPGDWTVTGGVIVLADASAILAGAGVLDPAETAALLDLEGAAVHLAAALSSAGAPLPDLRSADDTGATVARAALDQGLVDCGAVARGRASPPEQRALHDAPVVDAEATRLAAQVARWVAGGAPESVDADDVERFARPSLAALRRLGDADDYTSTRLVRAVLATTRNATSHRTQAQGLHVCGAAMARRGDYSAALWLLERAVAEWIAHSPSGRPAEFLVTLAALAQALIELGDLRGARGLLQSTLAERRRADPRDARAIAATLQALATAHLALGDHAAAQTSAEEALALLTGTSDAARSVAAARHALGRVLHARGDLAGARRCLEAAVQYAESTTDAAEALPASLHELASVLQSQGDIDGALEREERALALATERLGPEHPMTAAIFSGRASLRLLVGDFAGAERDIQEALTMARRAYGTDEHPGVATLLHHFGTLQLGLGQAESGRTTLEHALAIKRRLYGTDAHPSVVATMTEVAMAFVREGYIPHAERLLEQALWLQKLVYGTDVHPEVALTLHELAVVAEAGGRFPEAEAHYRQALSIEERAFGSRDHHRIAESEVTLAKLLRRTGHSGEALALAEHADRVLRTSVPGHAWRGDVAELVATLRVELGENSS